MDARHTVMLLLPVAGLATAPVALAGEGSPMPPPRRPELRSGIVPVGSLGQPLGRYLRIEGVRGEGFKAGVSTLLVDTVDGQKLREPVPIWVENVDLPGLQRCVLKGHENCRMIGLPPAVEEAARESGEEVSLPQAKWQMQMYFVAASIVSPKEIRVRQAGGKIGP